MQDKVALVTGSNQGIGRNIALRLAEVVSEVAVHYHHNRKAALDVVKTIKKQGKLAAAFRSDLTKEKEAFNLVKKVEETFGKIDILVNNYGPLLVKPWDEIETSEWEDIIRRNLGSALFCLKAALPGMRKRNWGRVINIGYSRVEQLVAFPKITPYAIAKTGVLILTRTAAYSEASSGITVNMVSPGLVEGGVLPRDTDIPVGRLAKFEDISSAVLFLVSEEASFITGTNLVIAGGWKI